MAVAVVVTSSFRVSRAMWEWIVFVAFVATDGMYIEAVVSTADPFARLVGGGTGAVETAATGDNGGRSSGRVGCLCFVAITVAWSSASIHSWTGSVALVQMKVCLHDERDGCCFLLTDHSVHSVATRWATVARVADI